MMYYFALLGLALSIFCTLAVRRVAGKVDVLDRPDVERKFHDRPVPLLGGVALFIAWWVSVGYLVFA
ncbi:MAG: undecaprenyl/decaprenyl-phosphate alpha-N-acetylglucosaminyl 1-phosphate transferase, partial [Patescibacteria group bacterium]